MYTYKDVTEISEKKPLLFDTIMDSYRYSESFKNCIKFIHSDEKYSNVVISKVCLSYVGFQDNDYDYGIVDSLIFMGYCNDVPKVYLFMVQDCDNVWEVL